MKPRKKTATETAVIIINDNSKKATPSPEEECAVGREAAASQSVHSMLNATQWLTLGSIMVSLIGIYYKREDHDYIYYYLFIGYYHCKFLRLL